MPMMSVTCRRCGNRLEVDSAFLGETLYCAVCNSAVRIEADTAPAPAASAPPAAAPSSVPSAPAPVAPPARPETPKLRLAGDRIASGEGRACPACSFIMDTDDVVCANCGHNTKTGASMADVARRSEAMRQLVTLATTVLVLIAAGWIVWKAGWLSFDVRGAIGAGADAPAAGTNAAPVALPPPPPEVVAEVRRQVTEAFDRAFPVVADGLGVVFERLDGRVLRGAYRSGGAPGTFRIETADGTDETHPMERLKREARLRCDAAYRAAEIERDIRGRLGP